MDSESCIFSGLGLGLERGLGLEEKGLGLAMDLESCSFSGLGLGLERGLGLEEKGLGLGIGHYKVMMQTDSKSTCNGLGVM